VIRLDLLHRIEPQQLGPPLHDAQTPVDGLAAGDRLVVFALLGLLILCCAGIWWALRLESYDVACVDIGNGFIL
jgi:hypothetical protein